MVKYDVLRSGGTNSYVYQPSTSPLQTANRIGTVAYAFTLTGCGPTVTECDRRGTVNRTSRKPDVAAIETVTGVRSEPFNEALTDLDPTRRLQYTSSRHVDGPSGVIKSARVRKKVRVGGARGGAVSGRITALNQCRTLEYTFGHARVCGFTVIDAEDVLRGDSGGLVTYKGTSNRHVVGMLFAGDTGSNDRYVIPAQDIKTAFSRAGQAFSHYWGTRSGYRKPSTQMTND